MSQPTVLTARPSAISPSTVVNVPAHVVFRTFSNETLVLDLEAGMYHGLNSTGGRILEVLAETGQVQAAVEALGAEYDRSPELLEAEICDYCSHLVEHKLLRLVAAA